MDRQTLLGCLHAGDFGRLFRECGWNNPASAEPFGLRLGGTDLVFREVAQMKGFRVYVCETETLPDSAACRWLDGRLRRRSHDYLAVYAEVPAAASAGAPEAGARMHHLWAVPVTGADKRQLVKIEYDADNHAAFLAEKLDAVSFGFDEEPSIVDVAARVNAAFLVNAAEVTKRFYREFRLEHNRFRDGIEGLSDPADRDWYASVMLNRLMFCYFIQKRGFLDADPDYLSRKLAWVQATRGENRFQSFYRSFLRNLFREGLDKPSARRDTAYFRRTYGRIPYLNGGMFAEHPLEAAHRGIDIPDGVFERLFAFFDQWRWHLDTRLSSSGRDINPDVLGYIFEQYINDRAEMGAYYTKEDITEYISRNTIVPWLLGELERKGEKDLFGGVAASGDRYIFPAMLKGVDLPLPEDIARGVPVEPAATLRARRAAWNRPADAAFALPTEIWRETVARRERVAELRRKIAAGEVRSADDFVTLNLDIRGFAEDLVRGTPAPRLVRHFHDALRRVTVLDPTCGSGAFLFAALDVLEPLYDACLDRMEEFHAANPRLFKEELDELASARNRQYHVYKSIILRNLYGVDLMHEATEIARLRLFLKLVAAVDPDPRDPNLGLDPLPDIDFNIRTGNTLVGYANPADVKSAILPPDQLALDTELYDRVEARAQDVADIYARFKALQLSSEGSAEFHDAKRELDSRLKALNDTLDRAMARRDREIDTDTLRGDRQFREWKAKAHPFHWFSEFYGITVANGGFDVIIGNPPYVSSREVPYQLNNPNDYPDIYALVFERCLSLQSKHGYCGLIVPISVTFGGNFAGLRKALLQKMRCWISTYDRIPGALFDGARQRCTICISTSSAKTELSTTAMMRWKTEAFPHLFTNLSYAQTPDIDFPSRGIPKLPPNFEEILRALERNTVCRQLFVDMPNGSEMRFSATAANFISVSKNSPSCFDAETFIEQPATKSKGLRVADEDSAFAAIAALSGDLFFWYWLVRSDGFDITGWILKDFLSSVETLDAKRVQMLSALGHMLDARKTESLVFKKNAGIYVGNYDYRRLTSFTMRADMLILSGLGFGLDAIVQLSDYIQRVRAVNVAVGEKGIPECIKEKVVAMQKRYCNEARKLKEIDALLAKHYGFTEEELDYIVNYDIKYRMGDALNVSGEKEVKDNNDNW